eukprot:6209555-Amphidinium_carterae.1
MGTLNDSYGEDSHVFASFGLRKCASPSGPSAFAKRARGLICRYAVQARCRTPEDLKGFQGTSEEPH